MKLGTHVRSISYLKAQAPDVIRGLQEDGVPLVITVNGEAKAVLQDIGTYEETQETLALLKILALGTQDIAAGKTKPVKDAIAAIPARLKD